MWINFYIFNIKLSSMDALFVCGVNVQKKTKKNSKLEIVNLGGFAIHLNYNLSNHIFNRESNPILSCIVVFFMS